MNFKLALLALVARATLLFNATLNLWKSQHGAGMVSKIIGVSIALIVAAAILPTAIINITDADNWVGAPAAVLTIVPVIGIVAVVAILLMLLGRRGGT